SGNTPPVANPDTNTGDPVIENGWPFAFGDSFAAGNVLLNDFDPDLNPGLHVTAINDLPLFLLGQGTYGTLSMQADGSWSYFLDDSRQATDALQQGQIVADTFTYTVADAQGATSSTTLSVQ